VVLARPPIGITLPELAFMWATAWVSSMIRGQIFAAIHDPAPRRRARACARLARCPRGGAVESAAVAAAWLLDLYA
jgi:hypothetical protein